MSKLPDKDKLIELVDDVLRMYRQVNLLKESVPIAEAIEQSTQMKEFRMVVAAFIFNSGKSPEAAIAVATNAGMIMGVKLAEMIETYNLVKSAEATKSDA